MWIAGALAGLAMVVPGVLIPVVPVSEALSAPSPTPSPTVPSTTTVFPSPPVPGRRLAGTMAGEGRPHPGRADTAEPRRPVPRPSHAAPIVPPVREEPGPARGASHGPGPAAAERPEPAERVIRVLPLGTGMALTGLGLGFIAWRLRRQ
ncbi:hypothetical protein LKL35_06425 [Streptomyces sp. ET3-23]|uniref:hypothetical protein n=1 Tax=Streptomyces sp. ET3-23 TaxID=2885643 RepID=UPI001D12E1E8|nr:hypothetical protein [Streptomyces sp. ET3-23]MCC2275069.1 hypothetical protein [Streptomyces sp. ET3-23]